MGNYDYQQGMQYDVDLVFCIDVTGSMTPLIETVKKSALTFYDDLKDTMENPTDGHPPKRLDSVRIRVIAFRDYKYDGNRAMQATGFFSMPEQAADLASCINGMYAEGGGDDPEDGLEALAFAIKSPWMKPTPGRKRRQIIVVWTDTSTHPIGFGAESPYYPKDMAKNFQELTDWWYNNEFVENNAKRLVLFAPDEEAWSTISDNWDNTVHHTEKAGTGLDGLVYSEILNEIRNSI